MNLFSGSNAIIRFSQMNFTSFCILLRIFCLSLLHKHSSNHWQYQGGYSKLQHYFFEHIFKFQTEFKQLYNDHENIYCKKHPPET